MRIHVNLKFVDRFFFLLLLANFQLTNVRSQNIPCAYQTLLSRVGLGELEGNLTVGQLADLFDLLPLVGDGSEHSAEDHLEEVHAVETHACEEEISQNLTVCFHGTTMYMMH